MQNVIFTAECRDAPWVQPYVKLFAFSFCNGSKRGVSVGEAEVPKGKIHVRKENFGVFSLRPGSLGLFCPSRGGRKPCKATEGTAKGGKLADKAIMCNFVAK